MSAYYATGAPGQVTDRPTLAPVMVAFAGPAPQSRLTVLVRLIMAIPHLIVLWLLGIAAYVVVVIGWFGALFSGRLPVFAADFLTGYLRWLTRVFAYTILLTDQYPPFSLDDADYPVRVAVTPGQLNRLAVLFRIILLIPCWIITVIAVYGAFSIVLFVTWLIVLITGRMPGMLHQALAAVLRYYVRAHGYALMLTSAYPGGLFGDPAAPGSWSPGRQDSQPQPGYGDPQAGYGQQAAYGPQAGGGPSWWLVLSQGARNLVIVFLVLGALTFAGAGVVDAAAIGNGVDSATAAEQVTTDVTPVVDALNNYSNNVQACSGKLACVAGVDAKLAATLTTFSGQLSTIHMPPGAVAARAELAAAVSGTAGVFAKLGAATTPTQYISEAKAANIQQSVDRLNAAYVNLGKALGQ